MDKNKVDCPDCDGGEFNLDRRGFLKTAAAAAVGAAAVRRRPRHGRPDAPTAPPRPPSRRLYDTLTDEQKKDVCFDWDYKDDRGLLRTHVSNNWQITKPHIRSDFYTKKQQGLIHDIFKGIINPDGTTSSSSSSSRTTPAARSGAPTRASPSSASRATTSSSSS